jgi:hypothetical protein
MLRKTSMSKDVLAIWEFELLGYLRLLASKAILAY